MNAQMNAATLGRESRLALFGIGAAATSLSLVSSVFTAMMVI